MSTNAGKLDKSLDDILKQRRGNKTRGRRNGPGGKPAGPKAPVGGITKNTKPAKTNKAVPTGPAAGTGSTKIIVSNLPYDVEEQQIKDYFSKTVGSIRKVEMRYGPDGRSRGVCDITFVKPGAAVTAAKQLDGIKIDNRPMKVEVVFAAKEAPVVAAPKSLAERVSGPKPQKAQPKPATATKKGAVRGRGSGRGRGGAGAGRGPKKTVEQLDAEMADYMAPAEGAANGDAMITNGGAVQGLAGGDATMVDDEML
ncbi:RNA-binding domain-containing protein [Delitschia confertaspora ATCC 74209]|uniref:RNA-binding domain-containing protein n=1 Tax=Delitschia confertaspora ATCC 74209 TaxID=1513339 RepID=A0A9P4JSZ2_9PLEO|nr:RNA-binding domain-containing protein [Delitschia confertaspora ATCC 74209]